MNRNFLLAGFVVLMGCLAWWLSQSFSAWEVEPGARDQPANSAEDLRDSRESASISIPDSSVLPRDAVEVDNEATVAGLSEESPIAKSNRHLKLLFVDDETGQRLPKHPFQVYSEQGTLRIYQAGKTNERGEAWPEGLDRDVILVRAGRMAPYAPSYAGIWLPENASEELTIRVNRGGVIEGQVVDDLGQAITGAEVRLGRSGRNDVDKYEGFTCLTDDAGRYRIEALACQPQGVWIKDGELRPESWRAITLRASFNTVDGNSQSVHVRAGEILQAPNLVVKRAFRWKGTLYDGGINGGPLGVPMAGALVSPRYWLRTPRDLDAADFEPFEGEVWTDATGRFDVQFSSNGLSVHTRDGRAVEFDRPADSSRDEPILEDLHLPENTFLVLNPIWPEGFEVEKGYSMSVGLQTSGESVYKAVRLGEGTLQTAWPVKASEIKGLVAQARGESRARTLRLTFDQGLVSGDRIELPFQSKHRLRLRIEMSARDEATIGETSKYWHFGAQACLQDSYERSGSCCGLGGFGFLDLNSDSRTLDLWVAQDRPYWIHCEVDHDGHRVTFGPFRPSGAQHNVTVELTEPEVPAKIAAEEPDLLPAPSEPTGLGVVRLHPVDSESGEFVSDARASISELKPKEPASRGGRWQSAGAESLDVTLRQGLWVLQVSSPRHAPSEIEVELDWEGVRDLGPVLLEREPLVHVQLEGLEPGEGSWVRVSHGPGLNSNTSMRVKASSVEGSGEALADFEFKLPTTESGDPVDELWLSLKDTRRGFQRLQIKRPRGGERYDWKLAENQEVSFRITGLPPEDEQMSFYVAVKDAAFEKLGVNGLDQLPATSVSSMPPRTFKVKLPLGTYQVHAASALYRFDPQPFEVTELLNSEPILLWAIPK